MHRLNTIPGGWNPDNEGVIFITQNPAPIIFLTAADTDIQTISNTLSQLPDDFPSIRVTNLLNLQQQLTIDTYSEEVLANANIIIIRLLGGVSYWSYGLEVVKETVLNSNHPISLFILPGDDRPDPTLITHSNCPLSIVNQLWRYLTEGGTENYLNAFKFIVNYSLNKNYSFNPPHIVPKVGIYGNFPLINNSLGQVGILFYRAHYLSGNTSIIDAICQVLIDRNLQPITVFVSSLRDEEIQIEILSYFKDIDLILNTTSFAISDPNQSNKKPPLGLNVPVFQVILSSGTLTQWKDNLKGLSPRDIAMNIALPEIDGRIITRAVSFKSVQKKNHLLETDVIIYEPVSDRINFIADLAKNWVKLRHTPNHQKNIAVILANYPNRDGRIGNGVGLDTPNSCIEILKFLQKAGYKIDNIPENGDELITQLIQRVTNDLESQDLRQCDQILSLIEYDEYFKTLPETVQNALIERWGIHNNDIKISGMQLGNVFIGIQPSRGYDLDPSLNYHAPDLEPTHLYLGFYYWVREKFKADGIIHVGKHGNLEWLPGKSIALSETCYPEIALGTLPNFYPFIVNDPGEGSQAKRRSQAVIIDHLTPPLTRAELYGSMQILEGLIDEYYQCESLNPSRLPMIAEKINNLITETQLNQDLRLENKEGNLEELLNHIDGYLCELKEAQIRDGLHIFGQCPSGEQLRDLIIAIARYPSENRLGLTTAIAHDFNLDFNPLTTDYNLPFFVNDNMSDHVKTMFKNCKIMGDVIEVLETYAMKLVETLISPISQGELGWDIFLVGEKTKIELEWIAQKLLISLYETDQEIKHLLIGLNGQFVLSGASGAPTRGRPDVLPTGRNFYSIDIRSIPTETAWSVGFKAAETLIEHYTQENGEYPKTLGLSVWGTSTMRTGGDDIAEALALLGVKPVWEGMSRRVIDFEILPLSILGRPRVDVTLRISGFFRDAFPNLIDLFDKAVQKVASLNEDKLQNPLVGNVEKEIEKWQELGLNENEAKERSLYRVFGSKPGAYGAGLQGLIEAQNWQNEQDLAQAYINWSCYAYSNNKNGVSMPEVFAQRLKTMEIVLHNQDNREHDLLDSDDYYQFQGGLTVSIRALTGKNPHTYFGDNSIMEKPKIKHLKEEIAKVYRSRVINPKWIKGVMRHGYKGAFEMSATVDYLFAYDATANCVEDFMYEGVANAYLFNEEVQQFIKEKNPMVLRDMAERLLEANQRGLWENVNKNILDQLRDIVLQSELVLEERTII